MASAFDPTMTPAATTTTTTVDLDAPTTIKMEDLHVPFAASTSGSPAPSHSSSTPAPSEAKPVKKRKSWGQVLPEPKTSLPPRKRAKTEDEKEQRRIERVKRNRLAAHNSRERKRQEYDHIHAEKEKLAHELAIAQQTIARQNRELKAYREKFPGEVPCEDADLDSFPIDTINPTQTTSSSFPSPVSMTVDSMDSPRDSSCQPETPAFSAATPDFDQTRYPAEILCDLQCRSKSVGSLPAIWALLSAFNITFPSIMTSLSMSLFSTLTSSQTPPTTAGALWSRLMACWTTMSASPPSSLETTIPALAFLTILMQSTPTCRQPLAQLTLATGLSQRTTSFNQVARSRMVSQGTESTTRLRHLRSQRLEQSGGRRTRISSDSRKDMIRTWGQSRTAVRV